MLPQKFVLLLQQTSKNNQLLVTKLVPFSFVHQSKPLRKWYESSKNLLKKIVSFVKNMTKITAIFVSEIDQL